MAWCQNTSNYSKGVSNFCTTPNSRNILNYSKGVSSMFSLCQGSVSGVWTPRTGHPGSDLTWKCESNIHMMSETLGRASVRNSQIGFCLYVWDCFWIRTHNFQDIKGKNQMSFHFHLVLISPGQHLFRRSLPGNISLTLFLQDNIFQMGRWKDQVS